MSKRIQDIAIGDNVKVFNSKREEFTNSRVESISKHNVDGYYEVYIDTASKPLCVTGHHPFYCKKGSKFKWIKVKDLVEGSILFNNKSELSKVKHIKQINKPVTVYNMEVEGIHNYFAENILVHNGKTGSYIGTDKIGSSDVGASRNAINSAAAQFNETVPNAVGNSIAAQMEAAQTFQNQVGVTSSSMAGEGGALEGAQTGLNKVLADTLKDNAQQLLTTQGDIRSAKTSTLKSAGAQFREAQMAVNKAQEATGMVSSNERMEMDTQVGLGRGTAEAQEEAIEGATKAQEVKTYEDEKAQQDFKDAVEQARIDMEQGMQSQVNDVVSNLKAQTSNLNTVYKDTVGNLKKRQKKNSRDRVKPGGEDKKENAYGTALTQTNYSGTQPKDIGEQGTGNFAVTSSIDMKATGGVSKAMESLDAWGMGNFAAADATSVNIPGADGDTVMELDPKATIQNVWTGATGDAKLQTVIGPGNLDGVSTNSEWIQPKCFLGETLIDVEVL